MNAAFISKNIFFRLLLVIFFIVSFFAVRIPLLSEDLGFEEGIFADLIVNRPEGPKYALGGRVNGENIYQYISHPACSYELLRFGGFIFQNALTHDVYLDDSIVTTRLRFIASFYQFTFYGLLLIYVLTHTIYGKWPILIIFAAALSPLAIKTSTHLQIDNTSGVILCGIATLLFTFAGQNEISDRNKNLLLFIGGLIAGLGKQEWSFALLAGLITTLFFIKIIKSESLKDQIKILICVTLGLLIGNIASYFYDSENYVRGLYYMGVFSQSHAIARIDEPMTHWLTLMKLRLPFILICLVLLIPVIHALISRTKRGFSFWVTSFYGIFLFLGYILSNWSYQPRYFCPSLAVLTVTSLTIGLDSLPQLLYRSFFICMLLVFISTVVFLLGYSPDRNDELHKINTGSLVSPPETVLYLSSGAGWNKPHINYVNNNSPYEKVKQYIYEQYGKELVKPDEILVK